MFYQASAILTDVAYHAEWRHFMKRVLALVLFLGVVFSSGVFAQDQKLDQGKILKPVTKTLKFVFIAKLVHPWYDVVDEGIKYAVEEFKKQGINIQYKWDSPTTADVAEHIKKIEANTSAHPDGLAVACLDPSADTQALNDAVKAGLNVITFDTDAGADCLRKIYVGHSNFRGDGLILADELAKKIGGKGKIGILSGSPGAPNHVAWVAAFKEGIAKYKDIQIVFERPDNDDLQQAVDLTESALQANPDIKGFFCCNASNPIGAARAITNAGKAGKIAIVGIALMPETVKYMLNGTIYAQVEQRQWEEGYWSVVYLVAMNKNHTVPAEHQTGSALFHVEDLKKYLAGK
jgi:ribose transport system substrate-binding protein